MLQQSLTSYQDKRPLIAVTTIQEKGIPKCLQEHLKKYCIVCQKFVSSLIRFIQQLKKKVINFKCIHYRGMCVQYKIEIDIRHADYISILYGIALLLHIVRVFVKTNKKNIKKLICCPFFAIYISYCYFIPTFHFSFFFGL